MPGLLPKKVRFAYENFFRSPPTPALSFSSTISKGSENIVTPPFRTQSLPMYTPYSPFKPISLPKFNILIRLHPLLERGAITWNLRDPPSTIVHNRGKLSRNQLLAPATSPSLRLLCIRSPNLPWIITVYASKSSFITLEDVFLTIYNSLRRNITLTEFNSLPSRTAQINATRAYEARYREKKTTTEYEAEKKGGMKRVDFLMDRIRFLGISIHSQHPDEWQLNI
ncbi:hypothetical protein BDN70DRAFT_971727 [Pholiota conissans]|uniref:DUF6699 domain-containing protein n=1 Tax=Pholiota conissans TaxID=109636 RepID=A0A9P6CVM7_9AGAR|nr:hypothetical protein BDN70DRAFT_971727 [Pholiota conissans]